MAYAPDNLVLIQLREIRATLDTRFAQVDQRFARIDARFDQLEERFDDLYAVASHTLFLSTSTALKLNEVERHLRERVDGLDRRVAKIEDERGS
jgi:hypothetical protein